MSKQFDSLNEMNISSKPGLYVHIPFCESKCGYCDFYSIADSELYRPFVEALTTEIKLQSKNFSFPDKFDTIYIGGGTPSLLSTTETALIIETLYNFFPISDDCETTFETNPGSIIKEKLKANSKIVPLIYIYRKIWLPKGTRFS